MNRLFTKTLVAEAVVIAIAVCSILPTAYADALDLPNAPLITSKTVQPNMMLFLDSSGSMEYIVEDSPSYDANTFSFTCNNNELGNSNSVRIRILSNGTPYFRYGNTNYDFGDGSGNGITGRDQRCFDNDLLYYAELFAANTGNNNLKTTTGYPGAVYKGKFLNWYFSPDNNNNSNGVINFGSGAQQRNDTQTRIEVARFATNGLIDSLKNINVGLSQFDGGNGAKIIANMLDVETNTTALKAKVADVDAGAGGTPLAEALQELGRYFTLGYSASSNLTIHPDESNEASVKVSDFFTQSPAYSTVSAPSAVTENWCQQNFIVAMTDGQSTNDQSNFSSYLQDYDGDCVGGTCGSHDKKTTGGYSYQSSGSDYADDVILAMHEIDLRPDLSNGSVAVKNNVTTYMVGFAEQALVNDPLMADMAEAGGGGDFLSAANSSELAIAFQRATDSIFAKVAAGSGAAFNTSQLSTDSSVYAASFNSAKWSGSLQAFELSDTGEISSTASWDAATKLDAVDYSTRNIFSYNTGTKKGIEFNIGTISNQQKLDLQQGPKGSSDADVTSLINYLKGDRSNEGASSTDYRVRTSVLGDIANSTVVYVGAPQLNWPSYATNDKFGATTESYSAFKVGSASTRTEMLYVGANDGMLHGFNADKADANVGLEKFAYIPGIIASDDTEKGLHYLAQNDYTHQFYVDLTPTVSDVYVDSAWRTVLIGGLRSGGKGLFALDITDPTKFGSSTVNAEALALWEFSSADDADFGYSYSKPTIAMMENGKWAVIVGNGYNNSGDGKAKLFILYIEQGMDGTWSASDYKKIDTEVGSVGTPNGLSTPRAVDIDGDSIVDRIYAGDLQGNMWAFDVDSSNDSQWDVAYTQGQNVNPLFTAKDSDGNAQPITTAPILAKNTNAVDATNNEPNLLVFFGTGKYIEEVDKTSTDVMSYYAVWDNKSDEKTRSDLTERKLITSSDKRVISGANIDWTNTEGWYFDFVNRATAAASSADELGERVISGSLIRNNILVFTTAIPNVANTDVCVSNSESWLMAVNLNTGKAPVYSIFDINSDGTMDDADTTSSYDSNDDDTIDADDKVSFGGTKLGGSMVAGEIAILGDNVYSNDVDGNLTKQEVNIEGVDKQGRLSWEELIQQ
ncbi:pilus assembly protein PilY [Psychromonas marina]|uniref:Pilus assembly protein PilY n=1 Tax=Psychromonas marina TaxID=88364 RepID=A0ABQ6E5C9_9GAMM|nr:PilC/PilY family type IV pilus protein [Psychromonas marina]GLS92592.1 pilus assembly protein PilY [Psychromonas marina]